MVGKNEDQSKTAGFFSSDNQSRLDGEIQKRMQRPTLVSQLKKKKVRVKKAKMSFGAELEQHWYIYVFLFVSALFTGTLGVIMGLAPYRTEAGTIYFHNDPTHIFLAVVYCVAFVTITEVAFVIGKRKFFTREENNGTQKWVTLIVMVMAGISILGTGIAGGMVIASNVAMLTEFVEIPKAAQGWVVTIIPTLLTLYTFLFAAYHLSSHRAASQRLTMQLQEEADLDHETRQNAIKQIASERLQDAELNLFILKVEEGKISAADARAAIQAGKTLSQLEREHAKDYDGDGQIGTTTLQLSPAFDVKQEKLEESKNA